MGDLRRENALFSLKWGTCKENTRHFALNVGFSKRKRDFRINVGFEKTRDFRLSVGFSERKRVIFA